MSEVQQVEKRKKQGSWIVFVLAAIAGAVIEQLYLSIFNLVQPILEINLGLVTGWIYILAFSTLFAFCIGALLMRWKPTSTVPFGIGICLAALFSWWAWRPPNPPSTIVIIENQEAPHIRDVSTSIRTELTSLYGNSVRIINEVGGATVTSNKLNEEAFSDAFFRAGGKDSVKLLITVGTQVSLYAAENHPELNRFFVAVSDPLDGLVKHLDRPRELPVTGFGINVDIRRVPEDLANCFEDEEIGFLVSAPCTSDEESSCEEYRQDNNLWEELSVYNGIEDRIHLVYVDSTYVIPDDPAVDIYFGWNYLNVHVREIITNNTGKLIIGPQPSTISDGVVATYGSDFTELGKDAARVIIWEYFKDKDDRGLGSIPVNNDHKGGFFVKNEKMFPAAEGCTIKD